MNDVWLRDKIRQRDKKEDNGSIGVWVLKTKMGRDRDKEMAKTGI